MRIGIIKKSRDAATLSELEKFKEDANTAYMSELADGSDSVSTADLTKILTDEYEYKIIPGTITNISLSKSGASLSVTEELSIGKKLTIDVDIVQESYVNLKGIYYSFAVKDDKIVFGEASDKLPEGISEDNRYDLKVSLGASGIASADVVQGTNKIQVTGLSER